MRTLALRSITGTLLMLLAFLALTVGRAALPVDAADHLDAPTVRTDGRNDINDLYVFQGQDASHTALVLTVNPAAGVLSPTTFKQGTIYEFLIDRNGDAIEDQRYVLKFDGVRSGGVQRYSLYLQEDGDRTALVKKGTTGTPQSLPGGGMAWAGLADDPFFFDLEAFNAFKSDLLGGTLNLTPFCASNGVGTNFFAGFNSSAIVIEVPDAQLGGGTIGVWARTSTAEGGAKPQIERMGLPGINTVFNHTDATKEAYNRAVPANDVAEYTDDVAGVVELVTTLAGTAADPAAYGAAIAGALLPDVITYDTSTAANFSALNGRALADDVIDVALSVVANTPLSDCVGNDSSFSPAFPYLAPAN